MRAPSISKEAKSRSDPFNHSGCSYLIFLDVARCGDEAPERPTDTGRRLKATG